MKLQIQSIHFDADEKLISFMHKKMNKLETFYDRVIEGEIFLRLNNEGVRNKTVEVNLHVPGNRLFVKEQAASFELAADMAVEALRKQLRKFKAKTTRKRA